MKGTIASCLLAVAVSCSVPAAAFTWPNVPDAVARALSDEDVGERRSAAARLRELPSAVAAPLVMKALGDGDLEVRLIAARAAVEHRVAGAGDRVTGWLAESDPRPRLMACEVLRVSQAPAAVPQLTRSLGDANADVRLAAATTLGVMGARDAVASLLGHLDDPNPEVRAGIVLALGRIGDVRAVVPLLGKVQDASSDVRRVTVRVLGDLGEVKASSALLLALRDKVQAVQVEAIESLGRLRAADATSALAPLALDRTNVRLRAAAVQSLGRIGTEAALDALMACLEGDDLAAERSPVREAVVRIGDAAVPRLAAALQSSSSRETASAAALILGELRRTQHARAIVDAMQRGQIPAAIGLRALALLGDRTALPAVLELLESPSAAVRRSAIDAASELLDPAEPEGTAVDPIAMQLVAPRLTPAESVALCGLLGRTGSPRAAAVLMSLAAAKDRTVRLSAIRALGDVGAAGQETLLLERLTDGDPEVRLQASMSLGRVAGDAGARGLLSRLSVASEQDRAALGIAFSGAMSRARSEDLPAKAVALLDTLGVPGREVLIEALGRMPTASAARELDRLTGRLASPDDRRKLAEAAAGHATMLPTIRRMTNDLDPSVQANAVWSLGVTGEAADIGSLEKLVQHRDVAVAANAVASIGRISVRHRGAGVGALCAGLDDGRTYVRANALAALAVSGQRCDKGEKERGLLFADSAPVVRATAASLLRRVPSPDGGADSRALRRCAYDDRNGSVAAACKERPAARVSRGSEAEPVVVFVVPSGRSAPEPRAPFALVLADGLMRIGIADRRGAVFERAAPRGEVTLAVPATLVP